MFKFIDRKQKRYMVLIGGWAFDNNIFDTLDLPYNYIYFNGETSVNFEDELISFLKKNDIEKVSFLGWSQGSFIACNFAGGYPEMLEDIILVGARKKYDKHRFKISRYRDFRIP